MKVITLDELRERKYGRLNVTKIAGANRFGHTIVECLCDCGSTKQLTVSDLTKTKSCGCILKEKDKTGKRYGALIAEKRLSKTGAGDYLWRCRCDCGDSLVVLGGLLHEHRRGCPTCSRNSQASKVTRHGLKNHHLYRAWRKMKERCHSDSDKQYKDYGQRGIFVCLEWRESAKCFLDWALSHPTYKPNLQIDRIDNDGPYSPTNCHFVTCKENCNNRRSSRFIEFNGRKITVAEAVRLFGKADYGTTLGRLRRGWTVEDALSKPIKGTNTG